MSKKIQKPHERIRRCSLIACAANVILNAWAIAQQLAQAASPVETQYSRAQSLIKQKHIGEGQKILLKICASPSAPAEALCLLTFTYLAEEKTISDEHLEEADKLTKRAVKLDPEYGLAYKLMAQGNNLHSDYDLAVVNSTKALSVKKPDTKAYLQRCLAYEALGKHKEALADITYYSEKCDGSADMYGLKGSILFAMKRYDEAVVAYNMSIKSQFRDWTIYRIVECYEQKHEYDKAAQQLTRLIRVNAQDAEAFQTRGRMQGLAKHYKEAIDDYTTAIKLETNGRFYRERSALYKLTGKPREAAEDLRKASIEDKSPF